MTLAPEDRLILVASYMEKATEALVDARNVREIAPGLSARSAYECAYFSTIALFVQNEVEIPKTHEGVSRRFYEHFVRTGKFPPDIAKHLGQLETDRNTAQYSIRKKVAVEDANRDIERAETYFATIERMIREKR